MDDLGKIIRFHRKKSQLTQQELATLAGVGKTVVFDIEKGKRSIQMDTLMKVLNVLNIHLQFESPLMQVFSTQREEEDEEGEPIR